MGIWVGVFLGGRWGELDVAEVHVGEVFDAFGLGGGVVCLDAAEIGEDVTFEKPAVGACGWDLGNVGFGDVVLVD